MHSLRFRDKILQWLFEQLLRVIIVGAVLAISAWAILGPVMGVIVGVVTAILAVILFLIIMIIWKAGYR